MQKRERLICGWLILAIITTGAALPLTGCQNGAGGTSLAKIGHATALEDDVMAGEFHNLFRDGDVYFAGLPTESGLRMVAERGVVLVINVISEAESKTRMDFNEKAVVEELGMRYVFIPMTPGTFSVADVADFATVFEDAAGGKVLIHCASANRAGGMWAAYLARERGFSTEDALARGREAGLSRESMVEAVVRVIGE